MTTGWRASFAATPSHMCQEQQKQGKKSVKSRKKKHPPQPNRLYAGVNLTSLKQPLAIGSASARAGISRDSS